MSRAVHLQIDRRHKYQEVLTRVVEEAGHTLVGRDPEITILMAIPDNVVVAQRLIRSGVTVIGLVSIPSFRHMSTHAQLDQMGVKLVYLTNPAQIEPQLKRYL